jgi:hypothetical protein
MNDSLFLFAPLVALSLSACGRGPGPERTAPSASAAVGAQAPEAPSASASAAAKPAPQVAEAPPPDAKPPGSFVGAKAEKACKAQTVELAAYQTRGEMAFAAQGETLGAAWRVRLSGKPEEQVAYGTFDKEGHRVARIRAVGLTAHDATPRVFAAGGGFAVVWFDQKGLAYAHPKVEPLPAPDVQHLGGVGPESSGDTALAPAAAGGAVAAAPFAADRHQLGLFVFASADGAAATALAVTHHGKEPKQPAIAAGPVGTFVAWEDGGAIVATRFDAAGKESALCAVAPKGPARERLSLAATPTGAIALWMEGAAVRTRALDASACPSSPIWPVAEGKWATITAFGEGALVAWVSADAKLLAARLTPSGRAAEKGIEASEGTSGVKDVPAVAALGSRVAFGWSEMMSPIMAAKRLEARLVDAACIP